MDGNSVTANNATTNLNQIKLATQGIRYATTCLFTLVLKAAATSWGSLWLSLSLTYLLVHALIFFVSYAIHSRFTFRVPWTAAGLGKYFKAVALFKTIDFLAFSFLSGSCGLNTVTGILIASGLAAAVRFFLIRNALFSPSSGHEATSSNGLLRGGLATLASKKD